MAEEKTLNATVLEDKGELADLYIKHTGLDDLMDNVSKFTNKTDLINAVMDHDSIQIFWIDINLGTDDDEGGLDAIRFIRPQYPDALIIVVTAYGELEKECRIAGADHFFKKGKASTYDEIKVILNEYLISKGIYRSVVEFNGEIADIGSSWVKIDCFNEAQQIIEKRFPYTLIKAALKDELKLDALVKVKAIQKNGAINLTIELQPVSEQEQAEDDLSAINLLNSGIWTNKLP